jgi:hypothetical protein
MLPSISTAMSVKRIQRVAAGCGTFAGLCEVKASGFLDAGSRQIIECEWPLRPAAYDCNGSISRCRPQCGSAFSTAVFVQRSTLRLDGETMIPKPTCPVIKGFGNCRKFGSC